MFFIRKKVAEFGGEYLNGQDGFTATYSTKFMEINFPKLKKY